LNCDKNNTNSIGASKGIYSTIKKVRAEKYGGYGKQQVGFYKWKY